MRRLIRISGANAATHQTASEQNDGRLCRSHFVMDPKSRDEKTENGDGGEPKGSGRSGPIILRWDDRPGNEGPGGDELDQMDGAIPRNEPAKIRSGKDEANLGGNGQPSMAALADD